MPFFLLIVAAILFLAAIRGTQGTLGTLLADDVPGFLKWALAIIAIGALGMVPALKDVSRYLLALVFVVLVVTQYKALFKGFTAIDTSTTPAVTPPLTPSQQYAADPLAVQGSDAGGGGSLPDQPQTILGPSTVAASMAGFDPAAYLSQAESQLSAASGLSFLGA